MPIKLESKDLEKVIMVGDRILVKPTTLHDKTKSGLYLPPTVVENEQVQQGYVVKTGPGYPIPTVHDVDESWKNQENVKYIPLQVHVGDLVVFIMSGSHEVHFNNQKYFILNNNSILMIVRDEGLMA